MTAPTNKVNWLAVAGLVLSLLGWGATGLRSYSDDTSVLRERVSVVETRQSAIEQRIERIEHQNERIEAKVDLLLQRK